MENNDLSLISACQAGDSQAFGQLYDRYFKKIYSFVYYKISHKENTEDLVAETFYKAVANINKFKASQGSFSSWLYRIARNTIIDHYRTSKSEYSLDNIIELHSENHMDRDVDISIGLEELREKLSRLNQEQQEIIIMRVWQQLSYKEIAEVLDKSEASCKMMFSRSIKELRLSMMTLLLLTMLLN